MSSDVSMLPAARENTKIGFVLLSPADRPIPSTRVAVLNVLPQLDAAGLAPCILYQPDRATETPELDLSADAIAAAGIGIVVFQKVRGSAVETLMRALAARSISTVYLVCDIVDPAIAALANATVVVTDYLRDLYPADLRHRVHVVHDGIERPDRVVRSYRSDRGSPSRPLRAVLVTSARLTQLPVLKTTPAWLQVRVVGRYAAHASPWQRLRQAQWDLRQAGSATALLDSARFFMDRHINCVPWSPDGVYEELAAADIGILPIDRPSSERPDEVPDWKVKSENRLTLKMAMGLPVVATPIPSYEPVLRHGVDGFFAESRRDWFDTLERLRDPDLRQRIGQAARPAVIERYSQRRQAERLITLLRSLARPEQAAGRPR